MEVLNMTRRWIYLVITVTALIFQKSSAKRQSTQENSFFFNRDPKAFFYDTNMLPDGTDVTAYLFQNEQKRFFFSVEQEHIPIAITITPCSSPVDVTIRIRNLLEDEDESSDDRHSVSEQQRRPSESVGTFLQSFSGRERIVYRTENSPTGIYMIDVLANDSSSSVKLLAVSNLIAESLFPELPVDTSVLVSSSARRKLTVEWNPSTTKDNHKVEYCLSFNTERNYKTMCEARANALGDVPPTVPPAAGFGFDFEKEKRRRIKQARKNALKRNPGVFFTCIGSKTRYSFAQASPGWLHFVDVFAVDPRNNRSTSYPGVMARTKYRQKYVNLKDAKMEEKFLKRRSGPKGFRFILEKDSDLLMFTLEACMGEFKVVIKHLDKVVKEANFSSLETLFIREAKSGTYFITVSREKLDVASFRILATTDASKTPYPKLPDDTSIRVFENLKTCNSVTLAWLGTSERARYCLYKRPVNIRYLRRHHTVKNQCTGPGTRKKREKVVCKRFRARNKKRTAITEVVRGLKPGTTYVFDVYVTKRRGRSLSFKSIHTKTRSQCS